MSKYTQFLERLEDLTDETVETLGFVAVRVAPLTGPTVSGLAIMFAFYDGGGALLTSRHIAGAYWIAALVGLFMMVALEGLTITHMILGDRVRAAIKRSPALGEVLDLDKAQANKTSLLWFTLTAIFLLETVPAGAEWWQGKIAIEVALFRAGLVVFPWLSRNAASAYSLMHTLEEVDSAPAQARAERKRRRLTEKFDLEDLSLERNRRRALDEARHNERLFKVVSKPSNLVSKPTFPALVSNVSPEVEEFPGAQETSEETTGNMETETQQEPIGKRITRFYMLPENANATMDEAAAALGVTKGTVSKKVTELTDHGVLNKRKVGNRTQITVNGHHLEYLNG